MASDASSTSEVLASLVQVFGVIALVALMLIFAIVPALGWLHRRANPELKTERGGNELLKAQIWVVTTMDRLLPYLKEVRTHRWQYSRYKPRHAAR